jgi:hypothetical protein
MGRRFQVGWGIDHLHLLLSFKDPQRRDLTACFFKGNARLADDGFQQSD